MPATLDVTQEGITIDAVGDNDLEAYTEDTITTGELGGDSEGDCVYDYTSDPGVGGPNLAGAGTSGTYWYADSVTVYWRKLHCQWEAVTTYKNNTDIDAVVIITWKGGSDITSPPGTFSIIDVQQFELGVQQFPPVAVSGSLIVAAGAP